MQLTALFLLAAGLAASAAGYSQKVSLSEKNAPLSKVFREIQKQTGYEFLYTDEMMQPAAPVTVNLKDADLADALAACFRGQPLTFAIIEKTVVVKEKSLLTEVQKSPGDSSKPRGIDIEGRVTDEKGEGLAGASIEARNGKKATLTDENGIFKLKNVQIGSTLIVSYTGYQKKEIDVREDKMFTVVLTMSDNQLDQAQVIAYGTTTERLTTGDVSTITSKDIEKQPVDNPILALEGRVPGIFIAQSTGIAGGGISVKIQGLNSISAGTDPFYVVDGVPFIAQNLPNLSTTGGILGNNGNTNAYLNGANGGGSPLSYINPSDIESISVLKDADATAIYGSRAANGAILITTKKGKPGQTKVDLNIQNGWGRVTKVMPELNTRQYIQMRMQAFQNDSITPGPTDYDVNGTWDTTRYTNWQKLLIGGTAHYTDASTSVSGGTSNTQFLVAVDYKRQTTVFPGDLSDQRGSLHFNINNTSTNNRFRLQITGSYMQDLNQIISQDLTNTALGLPPDAPAIFNKDGSLNWELVSGSSTWANPFSYLQNKYNNTTKNLIGSAILSYLLLPGLTLKSSFGYNDIEVNENQINPLSAIAPDLRSYIENSSSFSFSTNSSWIIEPQLSYNVHIGQGSLQALAGTTIQQNSTNSQQITGLGYNSDQQLQDLQAAASVYSGTSLISLYRYNAGYGRINYNWGDQYVIDLTGRRDGSSRFGVDNEFHNFGAAGLAWIFSKAKLFINNFSFLSFGKIRLSYGSTGNDQIGDYQYLSLYNPVSVSNAYQGVSGNLPNGLSNPYLEWENTDKFSSAVDLGFFKDRVLFSATYYRNRSSNLLQQYPLPEITGNAGITENFPATIQNAGLELVLSTKNVVGKNLSWTSSFNFTLQRNKLISFLGLASSSYANTYVIGQPINVIKTFHYLGVNATTGLYEFSDSHGNTTSSPNYTTDRMDLKDPNPRFYVGFQNNVRYHNVELDFLLLFVKQIGENNFYGNGSTEPGLFYGGGFGTIGNQPTWILNAWKYPGDVTPLQRYSASNPPAVSTAFGDIAQSSVGFTNASYIRLKNLSFSWQLLERLSKKIRFQNLRLFFQGQNLLTITSYRGLDPENLTLYSLPPLRVYTFGIRATL